MSKPGTEPAITFQRLRWPILIAVVAVALVFGALKVFLDPNKVAGDGELRAYLYRVVIAQARYFQKNRVYANTLEALLRNEEALSDPKTPKVLEPTPAGYRFVWQFADGNDFCLVAARRGGERWYTVSAAGARRSETSASAPFTGTCPALRRPS